MEAPLPGNPNEELPVDRLDRKAFFTLVVGGAIAATISCLSQTFNIDNALPPGELPHVIETNTAPYLTIKNETVHGIKFDYPMFIYAIGEAFANFANLVAEFQNTDVQFALLPNQSFDAPLTGINQARLMNSFSEGAGLPQTAAIELAIGTAIDGLRSKQSIQTSELYMSFSFIEGVFLWAVKNGICQPADWPVISQSFFQIVPTLRRNNFVRFRNPKSQLG